ncbi:hypothetical protein FQR65_LT20785 [Abscondita terminalis]|nr:hypothetical protein FQR65_LT20785 [Abscondita terminalis]
MGTRPIAGRDHAQSVRLSALGTRGLSLRTCRRFPRYAGRSLHATTVVCVPRNAAEGRGDFISHAEEGRRSSIIPGQNAPVTDKVHVRKATGSSPFLEADYPVISPPSAASLIRFLEHDDANAPPDGIDMMRQAVAAAPTRCPIVGKRVWKNVVAKDSRLCSTPIRRRWWNRGFTHHSRFRYQRRRTEKLVRLKTTPNHNKPHQIPQNQPKHHANTASDCGKKGQKVKKRPGYFAKGFGTEGRPNWPFGRNLHVAFMPWKGYNSRCHRDSEKKSGFHDLFTSIHIASLSWNVRDTKMGLEELTRRHPGNVSERSHQ